jgi:hypothetical protein
MLYTVNAMNINHVTDVVLVFSTVVLPVT